MNRAWSIGGGLFLGFALLVVFLWLGTWMHKDWGAVDIREPNPEGWSQGNVQVVAKVYMAVKGLNAKHYVSVRMMGSEASYRFRVVEFGRLGIWGETLGGERAFVPYGQIAAMSGR